MSTEKKNRLNSLYSGKRKMSKFGTVFVSFFDARGFKTQKQICSAIGISSASLQDLIYGVRKTNFGWVEKTISHLSLGEKESEILMNSFEEDLSNWS